MKQKTKRICATFILLTMLVCSNLSVLADGCDHQYQTYSREYVYQGRVRSCLIPGCVITMRGYFCRYRCYYCQHEKVTIETTPHHSMYHIN